MLPKLDVAEIEAITKELDPIKALSDAFVPSLETERDSIIQTLEAKREELDRQIEAWKAETDKRVEARKLEDLCAMRVLNRSLNQHSIICRIPPKLLGRITLYTSYPYQRPDDDMDDYGANKVPAKDRHGPYAWIRVTHVCHHWRTTALDTPYLWTRIVASKFSDCMAEMARRSKALPLRVETCKMQHYGYKIDHYLDFVIENIQRIESVDLAWLNHSVKPNVIGEAPILRELHIVDDTLHSLPVPPALETLRLYEGFKLKPFWTFTCGIPGLRRLELYGVKLPRNVAKLFSQFSSLEYLVLSKLERDRNINALLKLDLSASRDISLPNLKLLSVKINSRGIVTCNLLSRFLLLPSTKVAILADYLAQIFDEVENNVEFVAHNISRALFSSEGTEFSTVALEITQNVIIFKGWWTAPTPPMHQHIGNRLAEHVERPDFFFRTYLLEGEDHVIEGLMRQFNLARVATLMVETSLNDESTLLSVPSWARILQRIESVTSLYCRGIGIERLLDSLGVRQYEYERGERIVLPHLRKVFVSEDPYYSSWPYRSRPAFETLKRFAKRRQSLDDALDFVSYYAGCPQASDMETLQSLVLELDTSGTLWK